MLYIQICLIGLSILAIPLLNRQHSYGRDGELFRATIVCVMLDMILETLGWMLNGKQFPGAYAVIYLVNLFTILLQPAMGLLWFYYTLEALELRPAKHSPLRLAYAAPFLLNAMLLLTNYWTEHIFVIDASNVYVRGELFWIDVIVSFLYPVAATVIALDASFRTTSKAKKHDCYVLASFVLPPVIAAVIQVIWYGTFLFLIGFAISLLIVFVNIQNEQITVDFLTRVNNRASFLTYYERKSHSIRPGSFLCLFMIDVDSFKRINDTYGHAVGDLVLTTVADQLKRVCAGQKCFLARLGGDEFGILLECEQMREVYEFIDRIQAALDEFNSDSNLSAPVTLSVGYATREHEACSIDRLIQQADTMMYAQKARHHLADTGRRS